MNERIKELYIQTANETADGKEWAIGGLINAEKFAELIVRECMLICRRHPSRNLDNNWDVDAVAPDLVQQFEEYFGVEE
jgi:hypothetical protein